MSVWVGMLFRQADQYQKSEGSKGGESRGIWEDAINLLREVIKRTRTMPTLVPVCQYFRVCFKINAPARCEDLLKIYNKQVLLRLAWPRSAWLRSAWLHRHGHARHGPHLASIDSPTAY